MTTPADFRFPQRLRLKTPAQFQVVYALKKSAGDGLLVVYAGPNGLPHPRVGLSVSRKVGGAVIRNRLKRLLREAFRLSRAELPAGVDLILIPRGGVSPRLEYLQKSLVKLANQAARKLASRERERPEEAATTSPPSPPGPPVAHAPGSPEPAP